MYEHMFASGRTSCKEVVELGEHLVRLFEDVAPGVAAELITAAPGGCGEASGSRRNGRRRVCL
jgi:hypothetical protein